MTHHLSIRLPWHDRGWDGYVCDEPKLNTLCVVQKAIKAGRRIETEEEFQGKPFSELSERNLDYMPPCAIQAMAYSDSICPVKVIPGNPTIWNMPTYCTSAIPLRWIKGEFAKEIATKWGIQSVEKRIDGRSKYWLYSYYIKYTLIQDFWSRIKPSKSLVFYYLKDGAPFSESSKMLLAGVGRIKEHYPLVLGRYDMGGLRNDQKGQMPFLYVVRQDFPNQGARIPYQEWFRLENNMKEITCAIPPQHKHSFSYVSEYVSDDQAITLVDRMIRIFKRLVFEAPSNREWKHQLKWLQGVSRELWDSRPSNPGMASFLEYFRFKASLDFTDSFYDWAKLRDEAPETLLFNLIENDQWELLHKKYRENFKSVTRKWRRNFDDDTAELRKLLTRFEISAEQFSNFSDDEYLSNLGIKSKKQVIDNPYLLVERDSGSKQELPVSFETIDQGMQFMDPGLEDSRRIRALMHKYLSLEALDGHMEIQLTEINKKLPKSIDGEYIKEYKPFFDELLTFKMRQKPPMVCLKKLNEYQSVIADFIDLENKKENDVSEHLIDWRQRLEKEFGAPVNKRYEQACQDQAKALAIMYKKRISILRGSAGTGKTSLLNVLLKALDENKDREGVRNTICLLAPSGKARVRLLELTMKSEFKKWKHRNVKTIHQFFNDRKMLISDTLKIEEVHAAVKPYQVNNLIIDECSMIPVDVLGPLLSVIDKRRLKRLILVGDPNQLEPIGPGKPFIDAIKKLEIANPDCIATLEECVRSAPNSEAEGKASAALTIANGFREKRTNIQKKHSLEKLEELELKKSVGDLELIIWDGLDDMQDKISFALKKILGITHGDYESFNKSLGIKSYGREKEKFRDWDVRKAESWQILCPTRIRYFGTGYINNYIQDTYRGAMKNNGRDPNKPDFGWPFGQSELVFRDKVIQIANRKQKSIPKKGSLNYASNGEVGLVVKTSPKGDRTYPSRNKDMIDVTYSTQPGFRYRYSRMFVDYCLELGYAITVHKAQGSEFDTVFFIVPKDIGNLLSKKLIYTGFTRSKKKLVLLVEKDLESLKDMIRG